MNRPDIGGDDKEPGQGLLFRLTLKRVHKNSQKRRYTGSAASKWAEADWTGTE